MADNDDSQPKAGLRKDGQPYKEGNTREDGSYATGKYRPPAHGQFRENDGRKRGRRKKGTKNVLTEWREELGAKYTLKINGKQHSMTKLRALVVTNIERGIRGSDRAAELALRYAELSEKRDPGLQANDYEVIAAWFRTMLAEGDSDDASDNDHGGPESPDA